MMNYTSEKLLQEDFLKSDYFNNIVIQQSYKFQMVEPKGLFGIPDVVIAKINDDGLQVESLAFELKLKNWKRALIQAFRYRSFAKKSFVVMDDKYIKPALSNLDSFIRTNIGLLSVENGKVKVIYDPNSKKPYSPNMLGKMNSIVSNIAKLTE